MDGVNKGNILNLNPPKNTIIKKTICLFCENEFLIDLTSTIQACASESSQSIITLDSVEVTIVESPVLFATTATTTFSGSGCSGAMPALSPDRKWLEITFPNFFVVVDGSIPDECCSSSHCRATIKLNTTGSEKHTKFKMNVTIRGQAIVETGSYVSIFGDCKRLLRIDGPYANNYEANLIIKGKLVYCKCCFC